MIIAVLFIFFCVSSRAENPTAYEVYSKLLEESLDSSVRYSEGMLKWVLIRIGRSHSILNLMSPSSDTLDELVQSLTKEDRQLFVQTFFMREGKKWEEVLAEGRERGDVPLTFVSSDTAESMFYGKFPGFGSEGLQSSYDEPWNVIPREEFNADRFFPVLSSRPLHLLGLAGNEDSLEWQLSFREQKSYGDFEDMLRWVRETLGLPDRTLSDEVHIRVFSNDLPPKKKRMAFRLGDIVYSHGNFSEDLAWMRLFDQALAARVLSGDFSGAGGMFSLNGITPSSLPSARELTDRFGIPVETAEKALVNIAEASDHWGPNILVPLSSWHKTPLGEMKKKALEFLAQTFVEASAVVEGDRESRMLGMSDLFKLWHTESSIQADMNSAFRPRPRGRVGEVLSFAPSPLQKSSVDVNKIALGIEYTGRFPIETYMFAQRGNEEKKFIIVPWSRQREDIFQSVARELSLRLRGSGEVTRKVGGHGHGLGYSYTFLDGKNRSWNVSWDGIRRKYDQTGKVVEGSVSGGHLEVSTAKFVPKAWEIEAVYKVFKKFDIAPQPGMAGGGHINVDLSPFGGRPRAMARFLALFHQYQEVITLMFSREAHFFPAYYERLLKELKDFQGSESELKELLYNERYFYPLPDSKTRYTWVNIIPYFQEVIPSEFLSQDVDYQNPTISWRPRFRFVAPEEKRIELRFFDAPRDAFESALHIRFVRAMLHGAFNQDFPLDGRHTEEVLDSMSSYYKGPQKAFRDLDLLCQTLQLECHLYRPLLAERLNDLDIWKQSFGNFLDRPIGEVEAKEYMAHAESVKNSDHIWGQAISCEKQAQRLLGGDP